MMAVAWMRIVSIPYWWGALSGVFGGVATYTIRMGVRIKPGGGVSLVVHATLWRQGCGTAMVFTGVCSSGGYGAWVYVYGLGLLAGVDCRWLVWTRRVFLCINATSHTRETLVILLD